ncbi:MAG: hypothetical protein QOF86_3950 [Baekduia sp.]|jgi:hypothetical protein|nr:hypothetical protein [Baekduia sp.]MEA2283473.1 hypothetical protein [Solirubrobacteraceae bacterium]
MSYEQEAENCLRVAKAALAEAAKAEERQVMFREAQFQIASAVVNALLEIADAIRSGPRA